MRKLIDWWQARQPSLTPREPTSWRVDEREGFWYIAVDGKPFRDGNGHQMYYATRERAERAARIYSRNETSADIRALIREWQAEGQAIDAHYWQWLRETEARERGESQP